jgi:hypothetical protein
MRRLSVALRRASDLPVSPFFGGAAQQFFV